MTGRNQEAAVEEARPPTHLSESQVGSTFSRTHEWRFDSSFWGHGRACNLVERMAEQHLLGRCKAHVSATLRTGRANWRVGSGVQGVTLGERTE